MATQIFQIGKVFPRRNPMPGQDFTLADFTLGFFDIIAFLSDPSSDEINAWRKGPIEYGIYAHGALPFFIVHFRKDGWSVDININIFKINDNAAREAWLNKEGNVINMYLVNSHSHVLEGMRMISILKTEAERFKDILEEQSEIYKEAQEVELKIARIQHTLPTSEMIKRCKMMRL